MDRYQQLVVQELAGANSVSQLRKALADARPGKAIAVRGLRGSALSGVVASLSELPDPDAPPRPLVFVITSHYEKAGELADDLSFFGVRSVFHWPKSEVLPYDDDEPAMEEQVRHFEFLEWLLAQDAKAAAPPSPTAVCVAPIEALFSRTVPLAALRKHMLRVAFGERLNPEDFADQAEALGYSRTATVEARGEFAVRGGILDIFPLDAELPLRIDLFGDEVESIRPFDPATQRSNRNQLIESIVLFPAREKAIIETAINELAADATLPTLIDLLPAGTLMLLDGVEGYAMLDERFRQLTERQYAAHQSTEVPLTPPARLYATLGDLERAGRRLVQVVHSLAETSGKNVVIETTSFETQKPSLEHYIGQIRLRLQDGYLVTVVADNEGQTRRLEDLFAEHEIGTIRWEADKDRWTHGGNVVDSPRKNRGTGGGFSPDVVLSNGLLHAGFVLPEASLYVVTDREIFGRYKRRHVYRKLYKGQPIADPRQIRQGDYVVHLEHGVGKFEGIRTQKLDDRTADFLELTYSDGARLLVPVEKIHLVQKFSSADAAPAALDKLGSKKWAQRRQKSMEEIKKLAAELIELYARRELAPGYRFGDDTPAQREFEASFLHTETPDQLKAIDEVKRDMMSDKPMDRLVCGDVGFGKTEVAIRAAFKAIQDGKQVAILCPTTILAQQHYLTFRERFADWPIRVEKISRFETPKQTKEVLAGLAAGTVHLVVGTHALLSKTTKFKDLGLVIVDEEQRFGVGQKDKLKDLRASVDFITLTATPIPRTLYMALSGLRDMSTINTPPADRQPIRTKIIHWDRELLEEAILRELNRGGQVFFIHNRVQNIHQIAERIQEIVPTARVAIAHGQMVERDLEQVMLDFIDRKFDILVSTTIIESGVDIPNCNTIIINRADAFGLAQLYQMRGRVGREDRRAYAYLVVPAGQPISEAAVSRLKAIEEFTSLGMGFNIALRDLEIRGTGNLLGKEQSGTVNAIGFELYCQMLDEAVRELHATGTITDVTAIRDVEIAWKVSAWIPPMFVPVEAQRVALYKQIADAKTIAEIDDIAFEVRDRYGEIRREDPAALAAAGHATVASADAHVEDLPQPVETLLDAARLRLLGRQLEITKIVGLGNGFRILREDAVRLLGPAAARFLAGAKIPKVYVDDPNALEFVFEDWKRRKGMTEAVRILKGIATLLD